MDDGKTSSAGTPASMGTVARIAGRAVVAPGTTRATKARVQIAAARRAEDTAAAAAAAAKKSTRTMTREELRVVSDRLHRGIGSGASPNVVKTPTRGGATDACTFTPKISVVSRRLASASSVKYKEGETNSDSQITPSGSSSTTTAAPISSSEDADARAPAMPAHEKLYRAGLEKIKSRRGGMRGDEASAADASPSPIPASRLSVVRYGLAAAGSSSAASSDAALLALRERAELKELNEACTFTPKINATSKKLSAHIMPDVDFVERSKVWAARKQNVLEAERRARRDEEIAECSFGPKTTATTATARFTTPVKTSLSRTESGGSRDTFAHPVHTPQSATTMTASTPASTDFTAAGTRAYLARQQSARKMREDKNAAIAGFTGATWRYENTVPVEFSFSTNDRAIERTTKSVEREQGAADADASRTPPNLTSSSTYAAARAKFYNARNRTPPPPPLL